MRGDLGPAWLHDPKRPTTAEFWLPEEPPLKPSPAILANRAKWTNTGSVRPPFAETPRPGQRSVWDFPRPPAIQPVAAVVGVEFAGRVIARTQHALQVLETAGAPTIYLPADDVECDWLVRTRATSLCEWKGSADHFDVEGEGRRAEAAAWAYADPFPEFEAIRGWYAFHPARVDRCFIGRETVAAQPGSTYGGWVTRDLTGPFKGAPGSDAW